MRNIWFVPTTNCLINWLRKSKFKNIEVIFDELLTNEEQRVTSWSGNQSLDDFLDPNDKTLTIEGHPAPRRVAIKPHFSFLNSFLIPLDKAFLESLLTVFGDKRSKKVKTFPLIVGST